MAAGGTSYNPSLYIEGIVPPTDDPDLGENANIGSGETPPPAEIIEVEFDESESKPGVDIAKLFKCFDNIPNNGGTTYKITLCSDVPVNSHPDWYTSFTGSPGHTFLIISKENGNQSATQAFGFYPVNGKTSLTLDPTFGKIVNDAGHEINASISMSIDETALDLIRTNAIYWASQNYDLDGNNCSDFAINLFNLARSPWNKIIVPPLVINIQGPNLPPVQAVINKSPTELYTTLKYMKDNNFSDAPNITYNQSKNYTAPLITNGECN